MHTETIILNEERNVTLTCFIQEVGPSFRDLKKRPAIIVLPGGGYHRCSKREAEPAAFAFMKAGFDAFVLNYSVDGEGAFPGRNSWPNPLDDYEQAMSLIRSRADEWNIFPDKIAVIGFSAGGHLALCAASMSVNRPNAAILGYAVTSDHVKYCNASAPDAIAAVDKGTCPCFLFATRTDETVPIINSIKLMEALDGANVPFECHIYSYGPHALSTGEKSITDIIDFCPRYPDWVPDSIEWLRETMDITR